MTTLIGTNPDQVPINSMLGGMAYQDPDSINVKDVTYSGSLTGGTGVINIGAGQIYKDASGNFGLGIVPSGNKLAIAGTGYVFKISASGTQYNGLGVQCTDASGSNTRNVFYDILNESGATVANMVGDINTDGSSGWSWETQSPGARTDRRSVKMRLSGIGDLTLLGTGATRLQEGTTAQRPSTPAEGMIRKNSTNGTIEGYTNGSWEQLNGGKLINFSRFNSAGDYTFTKDPRTKTIIVKMVGGGGSGATPVSGSLGAGNGSAGGAGSPGTYAEFRLDATQSTYYVRVGQGGAVPGTAFTSGNNGTSSVFSELSDFSTDYFSSGYGRGGIARGTGSMPFIADEGPVSTQPTYSNNGGLWDVLAVTTSSAATWIAINPSCVYYINGNFDGTGKFTPKTSIFQEPFSAYTPGGGGIGGYNITGLGTLPAQAGNPGAVMILEYA